MKQILFNSDLLKAAVSRQIFIAIPWGLEKNDGDSTIPLSTLDAVVEVLPRLANLASAFDLAFASQVVPTPSALLFVLGPKSWAEGLPKDIPDTEWDDLARLAREAGQALAGIGSWRSEPIDVNSQASTKEAKRRRKVQRAVNGSRVAIAKAKLRVAVPTDSKQGAGLTEVQVAGPTEEATKPDPRPKTARKIEGLVRGWDRARGLVFIDGRFAVEESLLDGGALEQIREGKEPTVSVSGHEAYDAPQYRVFRKR